MNKARIRYKKKKILQKSGSFILLIVIFILISVSLIYFSYKNKEQKTTLSEAASRKVTLPWKLVTQSNMRDIAKPEDIFQLELSYKKSNNPPVNIMKVVKMKGYINPLKKTDGKESAQNNIYQVELKDYKGLVKKTLPFIIPNVLMYDTIDESSKKMRGGIEEREEVNFIINIPAAAEYTNLGIYNFKHALMASTNLKNIAIANTKPNFKTIRGDEAKNVLGQSTITDQLPSKDNELSLDITFIDSGYTFYERNNIDFDTDVARAISYFKDIEPFKTRASQIRFHTVHNINTQTDLNCEYITNEFLVSYWTCDEYAVKRRVNDDVIPWDVIVVIVNSGKLGASSPGFGNNVLYISRSMLDQRVLLHEFGHAYIGERDEYTNPATSENFFLFQGVHNYNCYEGIPPANDWKDLVGRYDYVQGCFYQNWYRSSGNSMMNNEPFWKQKSENSYTPVAPYYNAVTMKKLKELFDEEAGKFDDMIQPLTHINSVNSYLIGNAVVEPLAISGGKITIESKNTDNNGVAFVQLWINGSLHNTSYDIQPNSPIVTFDLDVDRDGRDAPVANTLTIMTKAYDAVMNVGSSEPITIKLIDPNKPDF